MLLGAALLSACAQLPDRNEEEAAAQGAAAEARAAEEAEAREARIEPLPNQELTGQVLYQLLLAEIAGQRGEVGLSVRAYLDLARSTRDPRIARRAAEVALFARQNEAALEAAQLWTEIDPESTQARQTLAGVLVGMNRFEEAEPHVAKLLSQDGEGLAGGLMRLNRIFARYPDKAAVAKLVNQLTEPYLELPEAHYARGEAAIGAGDGAGAVAEADAALAKRPEWEHAVLLKAQALRLDKPQAALEEMRRYLSRHPKAREVRLHFARALVTEKQYKEARGEFEKLLAEFPDNADVIYAVGVLSMQLGDFAAAEIQFRKLLEGEYAEKSTVLLYLGQIGEETKRYDEALTWYRSIGAGEQYLPAQIRIAHVLAEQGKLEEARMHLHQASAASTRDRMQLLMTEAQLLRDAGRTEEAYEILDKSLASQPNQPDLLYETALLAERLGRIDVLESNLRKLIEIKPDHAHAYNALGYSFADRNERLDEAQQLVAKALELAPDDPFILDSMGWVMFRKGDANGALQYLQRAYALRADPEIAAHLGEVLWSLGRKDDAARTWREAALAHPENEVLAKVIKKFQH